MNYKIGQLILSPVTKNNTISELFVAEPDIEKETLAGRLFILIEIESKRSDGLKLANFLINFINNSYYQNEKLILKEKIPSLRIEHIFESVVSRVNKKIIEFLKEEGIKISTGSLNATIGLLYEDEIHFSVAGKNKSLLIYQKNDKGEKSYKTIDLTKNGNEEDEEKSSHKIFANVISGSIPENSVFIFSNEALPEYISSKQLSDICTTLPPTSAVEQIKNTLSQINEYISFSAILIKSSFFKAEQASVNFEKNSKIEESVTKLNETEQNTENILSPSGSLKVKSFYKNLLSRLSVFANSKSSDNLFPKSGGKINPRALRFYFKKLITSIKSFLILIVNFFFFLVKSLANANQVRSTIVNISNYFKDVFSKVSRNRSHFKLKYKIILIIFIVSLTGLYLGINKVKNDKIEMEKIAIQEENKALIEQKLNQAEASLLYENEETAKNLINEIRNLLNDFPQETEEQVSDYNIFSQKLAQHIDKVQKVVKIPEGNQIIDFSTVNSNSKVNNILILDEKIYAGDPDQNSIYIHDINQNITTTITDITRSLENIDYPIAIDDQTIYWYNGDKIAKLDTASEEIFSLDLEKNPESNISSMSPYNQRTYMLDTNLSQIYRYERGDNGLLSYSKWLNNQTDLSSSISIDIDGYIYVLDKNGTVRKFLSGNEENFSQEAIEPPLESANKIEVSQNNDLFYILDSNNSRIIVYNKNGRFIKQHSSMNLESIKDFTVSENDENIYILSDNKIYLIKTTE